jgi:PAS domain S-box-containing protein
VAGLDYFNQATILENSGLIAKADNKDDIYSAVMARAMRDKNGRVLKIILIAMDFSGVNKTVESANLPPNSHVFLIDAKGTLIDGSKNLASWVDKNLTGMSFYKQAIAGSGRLFSGLGITGEKSIIASLQFDAGSGNFVVIIDAPEEALMASAYRDLVITSLLSLLAIILAFFTFRYWRKRYYPHRLAGLERVGRKIAVNDLIPQINSIENDESGLLAQSSGVMADKLAESINTQHQLETSPRESEKYRHELEQNEIVQTSLDGFLVVNVLNGEVLEVNDIYCRMTGFPREKIIHKTFQELDARDTPEETTARLKQIQEIGYGRYETRHHHKQGQPIDFEVSATYSKISKGKAFVFLRDITQRKNIEIILEKSRSQLVTFIQQAPVCIAMLDRDMNYLAVSGRWITKFGLGYVNLIGMNLYAIFPAKLTQWKIAHLQALSGITFEKKEDLLIIDDNRLWLRWIALPWLDDEEKIGGTIFFVEDITNTKILETEIKERRLQMEQLQQMHIAAQTASAFAHEMNQPLLAIATYSKAALKMLNAPSPDFVEITEAIEGCEQQALRAGLSIRDIINFLNNRKMPVEKFDLNQEIINIVDTVKSENNLIVDVALDLELGLPQVTANRTQVQKVVINLLINGIEAMQGTGDHLPNVEVSISTAKNESFALMTMRDNGPGIKKEDINRVFEPFFTTKKDGIGMGLAISRSLIEENGGQLWLDQNENQGATFHLTLPF